VRNARVSRVASANDTATAAAIPLGALDSTARDCFSAANCRSIRATARFMQLPTLGRSPEMPFGQSQSYRRDSLTLCRRASAAAEVGDR